MLGVYFFLLDAGDPIVESIGFVPVTAMIVFIMMHGVGLGPVPWVVMAELVAVEVKSLTGPIVVIFMGAWTFLVSR